MRTTCITPVMWSEEPKLPWLDILGNHLVIAVLVGLLTFPLMMVVQEVLLGHDVWKYFIVKPRAVKPSGMNKESPVKQEPEVTILHPVSEGWWLTDAASHFNFMIPNDNIKTTLPTHSANISDIRMTKQNHLSEMTRTSPDNNPYAGLMNSESMQSLWYYSSKMLTALNFTSCGVGVHKSKKKPPVSLQTVQKDSQMKRRNFEQLENTALLHENNVTSPNAEASKRPWSSLCDGPPVRACEIEPTSNQTSWDENSMPSKRLRPTNVFTKSTYTDTKIPKGVTDGINCRCDYEAEAWLGSCDGKCYNSNNTNMVSIIGRLRSYYPFLSEEELQRYAMGLGSLSVYYSTYNPKSLKKTLDSCTENLRSSYPFMQTEELQRTVESGLYNTSFENQFVKPEQEPLTMKDEPSSCLHESYSLDALSIKMSSNYLEGIVDSLMNIFGFDHSLPKMDSNLMISGSSVIDSHDRQANCYFSTVSHNEGRFNCSTIDETEGQYESVEIFSSLAGDELQETQDSSTDLMSMSLNYSNNVDEITIEGPENSENGITSDEDYLNESCPEVAFEESISNIEPATSESCICSDDELMRDSRPEVTFKKSISTIIELSEGSYVDCSNRSISIADRFRVTYEDVLKQIGGPNYKFSCTKKL